jgi:6-phosphogluconolactonase (cycloisomerase 2 family)
MTLRSLFGRTASTLLLLSLAACGGGGSDSTTPATYTIGGAVTGLAAGAQIVLNDNGNDPLTVNANSAFTFAKAVSGNGSYAVTITTQPTGQTCSVANANGAGVTANVTNVNIVCSTVTFTIGGTVTGLAAGQQVTLSNGADAPVILADGSFTFATPVPFNGSYAVTVGTNPTGQTCTVSNASGSGVTDYVSNVAVTCSTNTFSIGGAVTGLAATQQVTLNNNGGDPLIVTADGAFTFGTRVAFNGSYAVTVGTQPTGQTCTVANDTGAGVTANVDTAAVTCSTSTFTIGGTVSGLAAGRQVTLNNNGADPITVTANGAFSFAMPVAFNGSYAVTVGTQPTGQTCSVTTGTGSGVTANVTTANITCSTNTFTIGGTVSGLATGQQVTLFNNGGNARIVNANGAYTFTTPVNYNGSYAVTVNTQPTGQTCSVTTGTGSGVTANVTTANITCSTNTFTIGGTVSGLGASEQVTLHNNGADAKVVNANGAYTFTTAVPYNGTYTVTVNAQPTGKTCTVSNLTGTVTTANVTNVTVSCSTSTYTIGGTITGLVSTQQVTLYNNGGDAKIVNVGTGGTFTFTTPVSYNTSYAVTVNTQPAAEFCRITGGSGSNVTANVTSVSISCRPATVYVTNSTDSTVSQYSVDVDTGALTSLGAAVSTTAASVPRTVAVDPSGRYAYVANESTGDVAQFTIGATGALTAMSPATVAAESSPWGVVVHPSGQYAYVTNKGSDTVSQYSIGSDGKLTAMSTATVASGSHPFRITISPNGLYAYVANFGTGVVPGTTVSQYTFNGTGGLVPMTPSDVTTGSGASGPLSVSIDPAGVYAYVTNYFDNGVRQFTLDGSGGLTAPGATITTGNGPWPVTISPNGLYAYWANTFDDNLTQCFFGALGALDCSAGTVSTSAAAGAEPRFVAVDPSSRFVYATNSFNGAAGNVAQFSIGAVGAAGSGPFSIATTR